MLKFFSPAKINLFFRLVNKRVDGFHNIESLFQTIDFGDFIGVKKSERDSFQSNELTLGFDDHNLIIKALFLFREKTQVKTKVSIHLEKHIPMQTGLGGGSSNGATMLYALNQLFKTNLSTSELKKLAEKVSSDSPFFFSKGTALCTQKGEDVLPLVPLKAQSGWIVKPPYGISTPLAYQLACLEESKRFKKDELLKSFTSEKPCYFNALEKVAFSIKPELKQLKEDLMTQGYSNVFMTGSGSGLVCFGKLPPKVKNTIQIYPFHYINRESDTWYSRKGSPVNATL